MRYLVFFILSLLLTARALACITPVAGAIHGYPGELCYGSRVTLTNDTAGGHWYSRNTAIATIGTTSGILTAVMHSGNDTILYVLSDSCGADTILLPIALSDTPLVVFFSSLSVGSSCVFGLPAGASVLGEAGSSARWPSGSDSLYGISAGTAILSVSNAATCVSHYNILVDTLPHVGAISIGSTLYGCQGNTGTLSDTTAGGTWSSLNTSVATINPSTGAIRESGTGTTIITYSVTVAGKTGWACIELNVDQVPTAITGPTHVCRGDTIMLSTTNYLSLFSSVNLGVMWTSSDTTIAKTFGSSTPPIDLRGIQEGTVTITATSLNSGCYTTTTITVDTLPALFPITGTDTVCSSITTTLHEIVPGGVWSSSNLTIGSVSAGGIVTGLGAGTDSIIYKITNSCGSTEKSTIITVNPLPSLGLISGSPTVYLGSTTTLADATSGGTWSSSAPSIATVDPSSGIVTGLVTGSAIITYTVSNSFGCTNFTTNSMDVILPAGISNLNVVNTFTISPNPSNGILNIGFTGMEQGKTNIVIEDITGRIVYNNSLNINSATGCILVNLDGIHSGIYLINLNNSEAHFTGKIVIE